MPELIEIASVDGVPAGTAIVVHVAGVPVALFNLDGSMFAVQDTCVRCGSSLAHGTLAGPEVACSGCDWHSDVTTGRVSGVPALRLETFRVTTVGQRVLVRDPVKPAKGNR